MSSKYILSSTDLRTLVLAYSLEFFDTLISAFLDISFYDLYYSGFGLSEFILYLVHLSPFPSFSSYSALSQNILSIISS